MRRRQSILLVAFTATLLQAAPPRSLLAAPARSLLAAPASGAWRPAWEARIAPPGERGEPFVLEGRVLSFPDSQPLPHARVRVYHADAAGRYRHDGPAGTLVSGDHGEYRVRTVLPGRAEGEPHVHFEIFDPGGTFQLFTVTLARRHGSGSDTTYARLPYLLELPTDTPWQYVEYGEGGALHAHADLVRGWGHRVPSR